MSEAQRAEGAMSGWVHNLKIGTWCRSKEGVRLSCRRASEEGEDWCWAAKRATKRYRARVSGHAKSLRGAKKAAKAAIWRVLTALEVLRGGQ